jgi:hypothetical protein
VLFFVPAYFAQHPGKEQTREVLLSFGEGEAEADCLACLASSDEGLSCITCLVACNVKGKNEWEATREHQASSNAHAIRSTSAGIVLAVLNAVKVIVENSLRGRKERRELENGFH